MNNYQNRLFQGQQAQHMNDMQRNQQRLQAERLRLAQEALIIQQAQEAERIRIEKDIKVMGLAEQMRQNDIMEDLADEMREKNRLQEIQSQRTLETGFLKMQVSIMDSTVKSQEKKIKDIKEQKEKSEQLNKSQLESQQRLLEKERWQHSEYVREMQEQVKQLTQKIEVQQKQIQQGQEGLEIMEQIRFLDDATAQSHSFVQMSVKDKAQEELEKWGNLAGVHTLSIVIPGLHEVGRMSCHNYYSKLDKRDATSTFVCAHTAATNCQDFLFVPVGAGYKIYLKGNDFKQDHWALTCHKHYGYDKRDDGSIRVFMHQDDCHEGQLWEVIEEKGTGKSRIAIADPKSPFKGWFLGVHTCHKADKRDKKSWFLHVHRDRLDGQLWDISK